MSTVTMHHARTHLSDIVNEAVFKGERTIICRRGKESCAVVSMADLKLIRELEDKRDLELAQLIQKDIDLNGTIPWDRLKERLAL